MRWGFGVGAVVATGLLGVVVLDDNRDSRTKKLGSDKPSWSIPVVDEAEAAAIEGVTAQEKLPRYGWRRGRWWDGRPGSSTKTRGETPPSIDEARVVANVQSATASPVAKTEAPSNTRKAALSPLAAFVDDRRIAHLGKGLVPLIDSAGVVWVFSQAAGVYMMKTEATVEQFDQCVAAKQCQERKSTGTVVFPCSDSGRKDIGADCVSLSNARSFCHWRGGRIPKNEEWQAEFTGSGAKKAPWGNAPESCRVTNKLVEGGNYSDERLTWCLGVAPSVPCTVKADLSEAGLCDMGGNLAEWVGWNDLRGLPEDFDAPYAMNHRGTVSGLVGVRCVARYSRYGKLKDAKPLQPGQTGNNSPAAPN